MLDIITIHHIFSTCSTAFSILDIYLRIPTQVGFTQCTTQYNSIKYRQTLAKSGPLSSIHNYFRRLEDRFVNDIVINENITVAINLDKYHVFLKKKLCYVIISGLAHITVSLTCTLLQCFFLTCSSAMLQCSSSNGHCRFRATQFERVSVIECTSKKCRRRPVIPLYSFSWHNGCGH